MGIPTYFRYLFEENPHIVTFQSGNCDYLFFDLNSILYKVFHDHLQEHEESQDLFIENIIKELLFLCNNIVRPKKLIYFALDGTAPRAKMVQQRSRRYKSIQEQRLLQRTATFSPSNHICPGTEFMAKFRQCFLQKIGRKGFLCRDVIFNDSSVPGEGEHKILPILRKLKMDDPDADITIMSPDNDILSLSVLTMKNNIKIMRYMDKPTCERLQYEYNKDHVMFIRLDIMMESYHTDSRDKYNVILDMNFLLSMVGNDFIQAIPYMKIKSGGMSKVQQAYANAVQSNDNAYLIDPQTLDVNMNVFSSIVEQLSKRESNEFLILGGTIAKEKNGRSRIFNDTEDMSEEEIYATRLRHSYMCNPLHPLYDEYEKDFTTVSFLDPTNELISKYYEHFCGVSIANSRSTRDKMVMAYLKSLRFTLLYYNQECPSWNWYYPYRVAPLFSDIYFFLKRNPSFTFTELTFRRGKPLSPFEQLLFILPPQSKSILPNVYANIFEKYKKYYPETFRVDAVQGLKYIYSEAILPEWDCYLQVLSDIRKSHALLSPDETERNKITNKIFRFVY